MERMAREFCLFAGAFFAGSAISACIIQLSQLPSHGLPYHDNFAGANNSEWVAYDGNWNVQSGIMVNESNERGAKLLTGSPYWTDYAIDADIALGNTGEAGVLSRVSDAEPGVDSYNGFYGGLRIRDESLVFGIADHGWDELAAKPLPYPITPNAWYHFRMEVRGCHVSISARQEGKKEITQLDESLAQCPVRGKIGLRSYDSGGQWKNVRVTQLDS
jgi:hypothetical protein